MTPIQDSAVTGPVLLARAVYNVNYNTDFHKLTIVPPNTGSRQGAKQGRASQLDSKIQSMDLEDKEIGVR